MSKMTKVAENWHPVYAGGGERVMRPMMGMVGKAIEAGTVVTYRRKETMSVVKDVCDRFVLCTVQMLNKPQMVAKAFLS